jgi:hypothetical protein
MPEGPEAVDAFLATQPGPMGALARETAALLRSLLPGAVETCEGGDIGFGVAPGYKGLVFTLTPHADHVTLGVADGGSLKDPTGLLEGKGKMHRHVRLEAASDLKRGALDRLLREAVVRKAPKATSRARPRPARPR